MDDSEKANWLFVDLNSYFASVEQQENPHLRGLPVAVLPVMADSTCCIAASYEAKAYGVKTGTIVRDAKALCPSLRLVEARQKLYVQYHHRIVDAVNSCIPVENVLSIDEMICRLTGSQRTIPAAVALAQKIKKTIADQVGVCLRSSVGLAPNRFLAKLASDLQKPDGLTILRETELPGRLYDLAVRELPGIGTQMETRLHEVGIRTVRQLCQLSAEEMHRLWGGVWGDRLWSWLRGKEVPLPETHRHSIGHSHVLPPEQRTLSGAYQVARRLLHKAAMRLRQENFWTTGLTLTVRFPNKVSWEAKAHFSDAQDTPRLLKVLVDLWKEVPRVREPFFVAVTCHPLVAVDHHTPSLFDNPKQEVLSRVMDSINDRYGKDTTYFASLQDTLRQAPTRIAFSRIPKDREF